MLRYFNFQPSFKLRWCHARDLFGSRIPVTIGGFELRISCESLWPIGWGNYFVCKRFAFQTLLWSLEFVIQINLEHNTIATTFVFLCKNFKVICPLRQIFFVGNCYCKYLIHFHWTRRFVIHNAWLSLNSCILSLRNF